VGPDLRDVALVVVRDPAGERLVEHAAERVDVGAAVDAGALDLLGRDVVDRADPHARLRQPALRAGVLGEAEVGEVGVIGAVAVGDQDVGGLDVAVDEPARVRDVERAADLHEDRRGAAWVEPAGALDERAQVGALDEAHRDEQQAVDLARVVDRHDVRVLERRGDPRLALEALAEVLVGREVRRDDLEGDRAVEREVRRPVDDAHPATPGDALDPVAADDVAGREVGHPGTLIAHGEAAGAAATSSRR
jgi:hypothetical protein